MSTVQIHGEELDSAALFDILLSMPKACTFRLIRHNEGWSAMLIHERRKVVRDAATLEGALVLLRERLTALDELEKGDSNA